MRFVFAALILALAIVSPAQAAEVLAPPLLQTPTLSASDSFSFYNEPRIRRARTLRTVGAVAGLVAPPLLFGGVIAAGAVGLGWGLIMVPVGVVAALASVPLLLFSSQKSRRVLRTHSVPMRSSPLPYIAVGAIGLMVVTSFADPLISASLYVGTLTSTWIWANQNLNKARRMDFSVGVLRAPPPRPDAKAPWGLQVAGQF